MTLAGLLECYSLGIPFFGRTILADLAGTALLFGLGPLVERAVNPLGLRHPDEPAAEVEIQVPQSSHAGSAIGRVAIYTPLRVSIPNWPACSSAFDRLSRHKLRWPEARRSST